MANNLALGIVIGAAVSGTVGRAFQSLDQSAARLGSSLQRVRLGRAASEDVIRYRTHLDNLNTVQRSVGGSNAYLAREIAGTEQHLRTASAAAARYGINVGDIVRENQRLIQSEATIGRQLQRTSTLQANRSRRAELGGQVMGTVGMAMMAAAPIKAAADFETTMLDVRESVKMTDAEFNTLGNSILHLSATTPVAASGIGEIVAQGGKLGIANKDLVGFTQDVVQMSVALGISGEEAGVMMAHWRTSMGLSQQQAVLLGDAVNTLGDTMNIKAVDLAEVIRKEGAYAMSAGFSAQQTAALGAAILNSGTPTKQAGMILKGLTGALIAGEGATKGQAKAFEALGMTSTDVTAKMKTDAVGALQGVLTAIAKQPTALQGGIIGNLFGPKAKEPILALIAHTESLSGALNTVAEASNYAGANQDEFKKKSGSTANQLIELTGAINEMEVKLGTAMLPTLKAVVGGLSGLGSSVSSFANEFPIATQVIAGFGIGLVGLKIALLASGYAITLVSDGWTLASSAMAFFNSGQAATTAALAIQKVELGAMWIAQQAAASWTATCTAAQWLWNTALSANPIGLVVIGITAFGVLAYTVYKNWEPIMAWFRENFAWLGTAVDKIAGYAQQVGSIMKSVGNFMTTPVIGSGKGAAVGAAMATAVAMPAGATPLPPQATGKAQQTITHNNNTTIHVTQKAGEDSSALAERIKKHLDRSNAADKRGALHD